MRQRILEVPSILEYTGKPVWDREYAMKVLIVYDSVYGNPEKTAETIGSAIIGDATVLNATKANSSKLESIDLLIVGSPTQGGRPTPALQDFLNRVSESAIEVINIAAFDTRLSTKPVRVFGYAAGRIASNLERKGDTLLASKGSKGPLKEGELEVPQVERHFREQEIVL